MSRVVDVRIERLHARYHEVTAERSLALDRVLGELATGGLDGMVAGAVGPEAAQAWAVCIPEVTVEVMLGIGGVAAWSATWAEAVADAVRAALEREPDVVVFPTRGDGLVDLVRRTALDDRRHVWAWRQAGLGTDVVAALRAEPLLVPGVLRAVGPALFGRVVAPAEVADLAAAVALAAGLARGVDAVRETGSVDAVDAPTGSGSGSSAAAVAGSVAVLPDAARRWAAAGGPDAAVADLAVLGTLTGAPLRSDDPAFRAAVATALAGRPASVPTAHGVDSGLADGVAAGTGAADTGAATPERALDPAPALPGVPTDWGGVWFLVHALPGAGLVPAYRPSDLALLLATFTGAPYADPSVRLLCGLRDDDPLEPPDGAPAPDQAALTALSSWLGERLDGRWDERFEEPASLWRRTGRIREHPGEIELELSLSDVDPVVRAAGLDLDPGWVGWLGAFVRFRYV